MRVHRLKNNLTDVHTSGKLSLNMFTQATNAPRTRRSKQPLSHKEGRAFLLR